MTDKLKHAVLWDSAGDKKVRCKLCSWRCLIADGKTGKCFVRKNIDGTLYSLNYDKVCAANIDPIEKKPLFHFQPASPSFSVACIGCNFRCSFCQNWQISQMAFEEHKIDGQKLPPEQIVASAVKNRCRSIAYTYTEPTIFMELCDQTGRLAKQKGLSNVFVSNGFMTKQAIDFAAEWLDGINIDLKSFSEDNYKNLCKAKLAPVLDSIEYIAKNTNIWMEITTLIVPGANDCEDELKRIADFIIQKIGTDTPWHISRFYPQYKYTDTPPTPPKTLQKAYDIGKDAGLRYVYIGNMPGSKKENTYCYNCRKLLIERVGYTITQNNITDSKCPECQTKIAGYQI